MNMQQNVQALLHDAVSYQSPCTCHCLVLPVQFISSKSQLPFVRRQQPIVVHCSAGIGRTGSFCAIDITLQRLRAWAQQAPADLPENLINLPALVHTFRQQRMGMVQVYEQYVYCYKAVADELRQLLA